MKKIILSISFFIVSSFALGISPELGASSSSVSINNRSYNSLGANARIWLELSNFLLAPQYRYQRFSSDFNNFTRQQYGLSLGYKLDLSILSLSPYIGGNYSDFNNLFKNSMSYHAGLRLKLAFLPLFASVEYEHQNLKSSLTGAKSKLNGVIFAIGLSF